MIECWIEERFNDVFGGEGIMHNKIMRIMINTSILPTNSRSRRTALDVVVGKLRRRCGLSSADHLVDP